MDADPAGLVRSGYNAISRDYRGDDDPAREYEPCLAGLQQRIPGSGQVLDIGCGCGIPVARRLAAAGHRVTGVDIRVTSGHALFWAQLQQAGPAGPVRRPVPERRGS